MANNNNFFCDLETGICGVPGEEPIGIINLTKKRKTIDVYYVTDPICSHCWGLEPVLRRFKKQYGQYFHFHTVMGGLLEKWGDGPVDPANGIYVPEDVAGHWQEVGKSTRMPIDGSVMIHHPVQSSYPPSRVFKVIQKHYGNDQANIFLRRAREALFVFNQNISAKEVLITIVDQLGFAGKEIVELAESDFGQELLNEDLKLAAEIGVRGFPAIIMINEQNQAVKIVGNRPLENYISGLSRLLDEDVVPDSPPSFARLLAEEKLLFAKEIEVMYDLEKDELFSFIEKQLTPGTYEVKELLGEPYVVKRS